MRSCFTCYAIISISWTSIEAHIPHHKISLKERGDVSLQPSLLMARNAEGINSYTLLFSDGPLPSVLQEVSVPVINNSLCETMYRSAGYIEHIPEIFICAGWRKGGFDSCEVSSRLINDSLKPCDSSWFIIRILFWTLSIAWVIFVLWVGFTNAFKLLVAIIMIDLSRDL